MPRSAKLKVYRTAVGFHDAYVAAPSMKAALKAWGTDKNLFARGSAELVEDDELAAEPLASPGVVIKRPRGTTADHLASLPPDRAKPAAANVRSKSTAAQKKAKPAPKTRPSRAALDTAEDNLAQAEATWRRKYAALAEREAALTRERKAMEQRRSREINKLELAQKEAQHAYDTAIKAWRC